MGDGDDDYDNDYDDDDYDDDCDDDDYEHDDYDDDDYGNRELAKQNFSGIDLSQRDFSNSNLMKANFSAATLCEINFANSVLILADLSHSNACLANMRRANLQKAILTESNLSKADLSYSNLNRANLQKANMDGADLSRAALRKANLRDANLIGVDFDHADLTEASLSGANLLDATFYGANLSKADFRKSEMSGLDLTNVNLSGANLGGAALAQARLEAANLSGASLNGATLTEANLSRARLCRATLNGANLSGANLCEVELIGASLCKTDLTKVSMIKANLSVANLGDANLGNADLRGANLSGAIGQIANRSRCRIDLETYQRSGWGANNLAEWHRAGAAIENFDQFPADAQAPVLRQREGLSLYFSTRLAPIDRFLIDGTILGVLGKNTDCQIVEFVQREDSATVRLQAARREDLETVAEALYRRVWEDHKRAQETALSTINSLLSPGACEQLSDLRRRLDCLELQLDNRQAWSWDFRQDRLQLSRAIRLFVSYAHEDAEFHREFEGHLAVLRRQGVIETWHTGLLIAGTIQDKEIHDWLDSADVILLLVSADFMKSDALDTLMRQALLRREAEQVHLIPIIVRPIYLVGSGLEKFKSLPENGRPISRWDDRDEAWSSVVCDIRRVVMRLVGGKGQEALPSLSGGDKAVK